jgi:hypothetical protein
VTSSAYTPKSLDADRQQPVAAQPGTGSQVVAAVLIVLAVAPVWLAQRLGDDVSSSRL